jgi:hypothetical protein
MTYLVNKISRYIAEYIEDTQVIGRKEVTLGLFDARPLFSDNVIKCCQTAISTLFQRKILFNGCIHHKNMSMQIDFIKNLYKLIERKMIYQLYDIFCRDDGDNVYNEIIDDFGDNFIIEGMLNSGLTDYIRLNDTGRFMHDYIDMSQIDYKMFFDTCNAQLQSEYFSTHMKKRISEMMDKMMEIDNENDNYIIQFKDDIKVRVGKNNVLLFKMLHQYIRLIMMETYAFFDYQEELDYIDSVLPKLVDASYYIDDTYNPKFKRDVEIVVNMVSNMIRIIYTAEEIVNSKEERLI